MQDTTDSKNMPVKNSAIAPDDKGTTSQSTEINPVQVTTDAKSTASNEAKTDSQPQIASDNIVNPEIITEVSKTASAVLSEEIGQPNKLKEEYSLLDIQLGKFNKEKLIEDYMCQNINYLWKSIFNEEVENVEQQRFEVGEMFEIRDGQYFNRRGVRIDFQVNCKSGNKYIVEVKNPKVGDYSTINAIGKVLFYNIKFPEVNKLVIVSTKYDEGFLETVKKFNLPIDFILFAQNKVYLLKK